MSHEQPVQAQRAELKRFQQGIDIWVGPGGVSVKTGRRVGVLGGRSSLCKDRVLKGPVESTRQTVPRARGWGDAGGKPASRKSVEWPEKQD